MNASDMNGGDDSNLPYFKSLVRKANSFFTVADLASSERLGGNEREILADKLDKAWDLIPLLERAIARIEALSAELELALENLNRSVIMVRRKL